MRRILVATDFSTRSDRAIRRGSLLAKQYAATLVMVHVVDDDQPRRLVEAAERGAMAVLGDAAGTMRESDGLACETRVLRGEAFQGILEAAEEIGAELIVMGPHRRQILRDVFVGTTVERTIRLGRRPVLMANAVPAAAYRRVVLAVDFSDCAEAAARAAKALGLLDGAGVVAVHAFDAPARGPALRASVTTAQVTDYLADEQGRASSQLATFLSKVGVSSARRVAKLAEDETPSAILAAAREESADLVVVGTHGRAGLGKFLLGSVAEPILRTATMDVLAVPPSPSGPDSGAAGGSAQPPR